MKEILRKNNIKPVKYINRKNIQIINTKDNKYIVKKHKKNLDNLYEYLDSRSFNYYPRLIDYNDNYEIIEYLDGISLSPQQKGKDLIHLLTLLHNKTTYYKEIDIDDYKKIYEDLNEKIDDLNSYYMDLNNIIDEDVFMAPSLYYLVRNISKIYANLSYCKKEVEDWYNMIKDNKKIRVATLHNNLELDHFIETRDSNYLINWELSKTDFVVFDLCNFYKKNYEVIEFSEMLKLYEANYPLKLEERKLLFILISIPWKIEFSKDEYSNVLEIDKLFSYLYKTDNIISPYYSKNQETQ